MTDPIIPSDEVRRVARLARLALSDEEVKHLGSDLGRILQHVEALRAVDVSAELPTTHVLTERLTLREDVVAGELARDEALAAAPQAEGGAFVVPKVLDVG